MVLFLYSNIWPSNRVCFFPTNLIQAFFVKKHFIEGHANLFLTCSWKQLWSDWQVLTVKGTPILQFQAFPP